MFAENLEGRSREEAAIRESELRRKITHILPRDIEWDNPVKWPSSCMGVAVRHV